MNDIKVFISSRMALRNERILSKIIIEENLQFKAILYENEAPESHAQEWWKRNINSSHFFVFLIDDYLSWPIYDELKLARSLGKHILAFIKNESFLKKLNPINIETLSENEKNLLYDKKIIQEDNIGIDWFYKLFYGENALKWDFLKSEEQFKISLQNGIQSKLDIKEQGIDIENIYPKKELDEIEQTFVQPNIYLDALNKFKTRKLIIISGVGSIGKSTMGVKLLLDIKKIESEAKRDIIKPPVSVENLERIKGNKGMLIIYDSPFGERDIYQPKDPYFASSFEKIREFSKRNWVVITTRKQPLNTAKKDIEERDIEDYIVNFEENAYDGKKLKEILHKHLQFSLSDINSSSYKFINTNDKLRLITRNLTFPHNIKRFVRDHLNNVVDEESLKIAMDKSKKTKEASKQYFLDLPDKERYFSFSVTLFSDLFNEESFKYILEKIYALYSVPEPNLNIPLLRRKVKYIKTWGNLAFDHQDYLDGALEAFRDITFEENIKKLGTLLESLSHEENIEIRRSLWFPLNELARIKSPKAIPIFTTLVNDNDKQVRDFAFVPLKYFLNNEEIVNSILMSLEKTIELNKEQETDPNRSKILYRKALLKYIIQPFLDSNDINGLMVFFSKYNKFYKLKLLIVSALIEMYISDKEKAIAFFKNWYKLDSYIAISSLQTRMWRDLTNYQRDFMADAIYSISIEEGVEVIKKLSETKTTRTFVKKNHVNVIILYLRKVYSQNKKIVSNLLIEWSNPGNKNEIQNHVVNLWE